MADIDDEIKGYAEEAIKTAKQRFGLDLDFSERSIEKLESILGLIYWDFHQNVRDKEKRVLITRTALIWGSYLGEYVCMRWGGKWSFNGSEYLVSIGNIETSPISWVHRRITSNPKSNVNGYLVDLENEVITSPITPHQSSNLEKAISQLKKQLQFNQLQIFINNWDKNTLTSVGKVALYILIFVIVYLAIKPGGISRLTFFASATRMGADILIETSVATMTSESTISQFPSYTRNPTFTPFPTYTPYLIFTRVPTPKVSETPRPIPPTMTQTPIPSSTFIPDIPTSTSTSILETKRPTSSATSLPSATVPFIPSPTATETQRPTATKAPQPTATNAISVVVDSCSIDPSKVPVDNSVSITFMIKFSPPTAGMDFNISIGSQYTYPEQSGCSGVDSDGDGLAYCDGLSGKLPASTTVYVTFKTSVGNCVASYSSR